MFSLEQKKKLLLNIQPVNTFSASNALAVIVAGSTVRRQLRGFSPSVNTGLHNVRGPRLLGGSVVEVETDSAGLATAALLLAMVWFHSVNFFSHSAALLPRPSLAGTVKVNLSVGKQLMTLGLLTDYSIS